MGKIFFLMGKSASGKDSMYRALSGDKRLKLKKVVQYTTRPVRASETDGVEYHFVTHDKFEAMKAERQVIESRTYDTIYGPWTYFTPDDGQINLADADSYLMIGTLESYERLREYYGKDVLVPLYLTADDGERIIRSVKRVMKEKKREPGGYAEICRRFLADEEDFASEKLKHAGICESFENEDFSECLNQIRERILSESML